MSKRSWRLRALLAACAPLTFAAHAHAQSATVPETSSRTTDISEIVVTATRRAESLSKVPASVSAFTAAKMDIQGIKSFADVSRFTPGVSFDQSSHDISIRGIVSTAGSGTTGVYIDDTPVQMRNLGFNANNSLPAVFDLDRIEVLRGPQGTLFGAGSEGGTVRYITNQPSLTHFSGFAHAEAAWTDHGAPSYELGFAEGGPLVEDKLAFRISAWGRRDGGYIDRVDYQTLATTQQNANWVDTYALRAALTWAPIPSLTITPAIDFQKRDQHNYDDYWVGISNPGAGQFLSGTPDRQPDRDHFLLPSLKIQWQGPGVSFISDTSYYARKEFVGGYSGTLYNLSYFQHFLYGDIYGYPSDPNGNECPDDVCGQPYPLLTSTGISLPGMPNYYSYNLITNSQYDWTQEFRLQSNNASAKLQWVAGVFMAFNYQRSTEEIRDPELPQLTALLWPFDVGATPTDTMITAWGEDLLANGDDYIKDTGSHDRQVALFGDATYAITDRLKAEVGLRFAWTHFDFVSLDDGPQDLLDNGGVPNVTTGGKDEKPLTPKFGLTYQLTSDDMIYATASKGYRIGGASPPLPVVACGGVFPTQYNSDSVWSYEAGAKGRFLDRTLQLAGSVYYLQWKNIQQGITVPICAITYTTNLGDAVSKGFDLQGQWNVTHDFEIEAAIGYTDANFSKTALDTTGDVLAAKGDALDVAPWTVTVGAQYNFQLANRPAFIRADYEFKSKRTTPIPAEDYAGGKNPNYDPGLVPDPATNLVNLRAGVTLSNFDIAIFANNVFNAHPQLNLTHEDSSTLLYEAQTFRPLTVGLAATFRY
ncbi:MAG: TonB-dependent receptor [Caulobacteraceae bacterium]